MQQKLASDDLLAVTKAYDLALELTRCVVQYPRSHRFVLGDRTLATVYDVLDLLLEARYCREKAPLLDRANLLLERLRFQMRLAHDEKLVTTTRYGMLARQTDEVGRLVGGWRKSRRTGGD
jgi:hypothetical protein